ncbi:MAG: site-specific DNA-methyltransferase [Spirochaetia bacterium]|nr:site-specific DNA-methyltransferase [Spirochaetia bacterium]
MPTLQFKGKTVIWNHHLSIPYHTLEEDKKLHFQAEKGADNLIIEGDNLLALKALLPQYAGKIKCIYIDPPYNTGNDNGNGKGWVYNDNVNSPLIKEWLYKEVGKEDLTRHDKWLCMMVPRLKLLRELLADDGAIFISIDDNEQHTLRQIMDEVFGENNFITNIVWQKKYTQSNDAEFFSGNHDFILLFAKQKEIFELNGLPRGDKQNDAYKNPDSDLRGPWKATPLHAKSGNKIDFHFKFINGVAWSPPKGTYPRFSEETLKKMDANNEIWFGKDGNATPSRKTFLSEVKQELVPKSIWLYDEVGSNDDAKRTVKELLEANPFESPKPTSLIKRILQISTSPDSIILDSFAGSGTTMHAVMELNKEDGGNRKCIMVQMTEASAAEPEKNICRDITRERVKRAIEKNGYDSGFRYLRVGRAIDPENILSGDLPFYEEFAKYVYYLCTGEHHTNEKEINADHYFAGRYGRSAIYLVYKPDFTEMTRLALNLTLAEKIRAANPNERLIVYAPACFLDEDYLEANQIEYVNIPYGMFAKTGK